VARAGHASASTISKAALRTEEQQCRANAFAHNALTVGARIRAERADVVLAFVPASVGLLAFACLLASACIACALSRWLMCARALAYACVCSRVRTCTSALWVSTLLVSTSALQGCILKRARGYHHDRKVLAPCRKELEDSSNELAVMIQGPGGSETWRAGLGDTAPWTDLCNRMKDTIMKQDGNQVPQAIKKLRQARVSGFGNVVILHRSYLLASLLHVWRACHCHKLASSSCVAHPPHPTPARRPHPPPCRS